MRADVRRNAFLLAGSLVCNSGAFQLAAALSSLTLVAVTGVKGILGLGPAIFLAAGAIAVGPAGRLVDRTGRMPVIRGGFVLGGIGCGTVAGGCAAESAFLVGLGLALAGGLVGPWLLGIPFMVAGFIVTSFVRPDPMVIAASYPAERHDTGTAAPLREILRRPGVAAAIVAVVVSFSVMASVMNLSGYVAVGRGHNEGDVFTMIADASWASPICVRASSRPPLPCSAAWSTAAPA